MKLSPEELSALRSVENRSKMIFDPAIRERLKKLGLIEAAPSLRRYRQVPYAATSKGHAVIRKSEEQGCPACGGDGRIGPYFPGGISAICANCQTPPPMKNVMGGEPPRIMGDNHSPFGPTIHFNGTGEDAIRQMAIAEADEKRKREILLSQAAERYVTEGSFENSGGIIEAAFEAGARWASRAALSAPEAEG